MADVIEVLDVIERNDCASKKSFYVTTRASDETINSLYRISPAWMPPETKLALATVSPMDKVVVHRGILAENLLHNGGFVVFDGDFDQNLSDTHNRDAVCRCGTPLVSDGFDIHCPNLNCPMTLAARLDRLGNTEFFDFESVTSSGELIEIGFGPDEQTSYAQPFMCVTQGLFWGVPGGSVEELLLRRGMDLPNIATFLVEPLFAQFLDSLPSNNYMVQMGIAGAQRFYAWMTETINRRDYYSISQNRLIQAFLWSIGIEALKPIFFDRLMAAEMDMALNDPAVSFAAILTNQRTLIGLDFHPVEAAAIVREVHHRRYEIHDIFYHYALNKADVTRSFSQLM
jgi:hypothetical protein